MELLTQAIYQLATALLAPVLAALLALLGWTLYALGAFLREWRSRRQGRGVALGNESGTSPEETLTEFELAASRRIAWMSFGVRIGPLLGLMGTLIPMGPALVGLSNGNIDAMAGNLVIVFSTTVVGVLIGGLCYGMLLARRQWYARDLADLERLVNQTRRRADALPTGKEQEKSYA